ncbi:uncharacterized protein LOC134265103, partial [Saccostrea cucullata]|uniref:uncharacterized protein LOC134265103 n=1 Tax=Saccostrea cuccullata TaxID=36930 RepID=UPI002ED2DBF3
DRLLKKVKTISGGEPWDIAVTKNGELVYTDDDAGTVNLVKDKEAKELIKLKRWKPYNVYCTMNGDLLVIILSNDWKRTKIIRYFGTTEKQTIELDDSRKHLFKPGKFYRYITENRNRDICVADCGAGSVVVVNHAGKFRFRYSGHSPSTKKEAFAPRGITTDSLRQILTADCNNNCVHILDQGGQFLRYLDSLDLESPHGLCTDSKDNLYVAEWDSAKIKKIKYK